MFVTACEEAGVDGGVNGPVVSYDHNKIWYTNGSTSKPTLPSDLSAFGGASLVSNEYDTKKECWVITFDRNVTTIGDEAFYDCSSLISITIPNGVLTIGELAFCDCRNLTSVTIPNSVIRIEYGAFKYCSSLISVTIPDSVTTIGNSVFYDCTSLTNVTIPNSVTTIGAGAFEDCTSLTSITIPDSVTTIGDDAFEDCASLTSVTIPDSVTMIGAAAFMECTSLTSITIPDSIAEIADHLFYGCSSLIDITIPNSVLTIGDDAFFGCSSLTSVTIPDSVTMIGACAFENCSSLTSVTIPDSVTMIGDYAFQNCTSLTSATIPNGETMIGNDLFNGCTGLTSVTIPDSITVIGWRAFENCSSLTSIIIPDSVTEIGGEVFENCTSLTEVYCKATTPPSCEYSMFENNASGRKIYVPMESVKAYKSASVWSYYADAIVGYEYDGGNPDQPDQPTITVLTLTADKTVVTLGETIKFTVTMGEQDVTYAAIIYDAETLDVVRNGVFSPTSTGTYSFFATKGGESSNYVYVTVMAFVPTLPEDTDVANTKFNHRILVIDHTGINDPYSPLMTDNLRAFHKTEWANNYNEVTCHAGGYAGGDPANSPAADVVNQFYSPSAYPTLNLNFYSGDVPNNYTDTFVVRMGEEFKKLIKKDGADAGIAVAVTGDSEMVYATVSVKAAVEQEYKVTAWLLESKIYGNQSGASEDYHKIYNYALRNVGGSYSRADISGDSVGVIKVGEYAETGFELPITSTKWKVENMDVLIIVSAKDKAKRWEVVNTALCPVNSTVDFEYME